MSAPTVAERVAAGAKWLDENRPGWVERIDLEGFDIGAACGCVLGQIYGNYWDAPLVRVHGNDVAAELGFNTQTQRRREKLQADRLQAEWVRVIKERRAQMAGAR